MGHSYLYLALGAAAWLNGKVCFSSTGSCFQLGLTAFPFQTVGNASLPRSRVAPCNFYEKLIPVGLLTERSTSSTPTHSAIQQPMFKQSIYNMYWVVVLTFPVVWQKRTSIAYKHSWCSAFPEVVINSLHHERHSFCKQHTSFIPIHHVFFF